MIIGLIFGIIVILSLSIGFFSDTFAPFKIRLGKAFLFLIIGSMLSIFVIIGAMAIRYEFIYQLKTENKTTTVSEVIYPLYTNNNFYLTYSIKTESYSYIYSDNNIATTGQIYDPDAINIVYLLDETVEPYLSKTIEVPTNDSLGFLYDGIDCYFYTFYIPIDSVISVVN